MARTKQREQYGNGSVTAVTVPKLNPDGTQALGKDGTPLKVQKRDRAGVPVWRVCVTLGMEDYVDSGGRLRHRQRKVQKTFHGTLKDARAYCKELSDAYEKADVERASGSYSALCEAWSRDDTYVDCAPKQLKQYLRLLSYVAPYLDSKPLAEIRKVDVNNALKKAAERPGGKELAPSSVSKMRKTVYRVFEYAVDEDYLTVNPCRTKRVKRKSATSASGQSDKIRRALTMREAAILCAYLDETEAKAYQEFVAKEARQDALNNTFGRNLVRDLSTLSNILATRLILATGMRRGEAMAMTWGNVDLDSHTVRVSQTLNETMDLKRPKTDNGNRNLFIDDHTVEHLRRWKEFQARYLHLINVGGVALTQDEGTPVFCSDRGSWIDPTNYSRWWRSYRVGSGFIDLLTHELRHTQITILKSNGVPDEMIQTRVGHAHKSTVTWGYTHEMPANDKKAADVMGRVLYEESRGGVVLSLQKSA